MRLRIKDFLFPAILILSIPLTFIFCSGENVANNTGSATTQPTGKTIISITDSSSLPDSLLQIDTLLIARKSDYRMKLYYRGKFIREYIIALGQDPIGPKLQQGDNKTPEGT